MTLRAYTFDDFMRLDLTHRSQFWELDASALVLRYRGANGYPYEVDLERCTTAGEMLDWIFQLSGKTWCSDEELGDLIRVFRAILDPQANLVRGPGLSPEQVVAAVDRYASEVSS